MKPILRNHTYTLMKLVIHILKQSIKARLNLSHTSLEKKLWSGRQFWKIDVTHYKNCSKRQNRPKYMINKDKQAFL